jgi:chromosome segregation ATPase
MTDYNPTEAQRLIAEAREDDERIGDEWLASEHGPGNENWFVSANEHGRMTHLHRLTAEGIARTRNHLPALADQLEAAGREVERLDTAAAISDAGARWHAADNKRLTMERDSLRQQLEAAQAELADRNREHIVDRDTAVRHARADAELARQERDLAQQRIAELEAEREWTGATTKALMESQERLAIEVRALTAALRAILPVYRAAEAWSEAFTGTAAFDALESAVDTARAAITPEIAAVLAGLEGK